MKTPKIIKADFRKSVPASIKPELPKIPDLILQFASNEKIYTLRVPSSEMGKLATICCAFMDEAGVTYKLEEKPR